VFLKTYRKWEVIACPWVINSRNTEEDDASLSGYSIIGIEGASATIGFMMSLGFETAIGG
jgi:hypothetical protein